MSEIEISPRDGRGDGELREDLRRGMAIQGYCGFRSSRKWAARVAGDVPHEVWYTERNGDSIAMILPSGTPPEAFPSKAMEYIAFKWIHPEWEFSDPRAVVPAKVRDA